MITTRVDWFVLSEGYYFGKMLNLGTGANYQFHKHFELNIKYPYFYFKGNVNKEI